MFWQTGIAPAQSWTVGVGVPHPMVATQPEAVTDQSEVKRIVIQPDEANIVPGEVVPVYVPNKGDAVFGPL